jgi:hypothetical protein
MFISACLAASAMVTTPALAASDYVKCDGQSKGMGVAEGLARLTVIIGTLGLAGSPEQDNVTERRFGEEGIAACTRALSDGRGKTDDRRRSRLILARAIHSLEAKKHDAALADARSFPAIAGEKATDPLFLRSFGLSAMEVEARSLAQAGKWSEAEDAALRMAEASDYDVSNLSRAASLIADTSPVTDRKRALYDKLIRMNPVWRVNYANMLQWNGLFAEAAAVRKPLPDLFYDDLMHPRVLAETAAVQFLSGDNQGAEANLAEARKKTEEQAGKIAGKSGDIVTRMQSDIAIADEHIAFCGIVRAAQSGQIEKARQLFNSRERWLAPNHSVMAYVTAQLQKGMDSNIAGPLSRSPASYREAAIKAFQDRVNETTHDKSVYYLIRPYLSTGDYSRVAKQVRESPSKFMPVKQDNFKGETVSITGSYGVAGSEALLLHAAWVAKSRGKSGFALLLPRSVGNSARVLFGSPEDFNLPASAFFNADKVDADLGMRFAVLDK